jgi:putative tryptophan/tyrosine transport system substrate-binding protein
MWYSTVGSIVTLLLSLLAVPLAAEAQQPGKVPRIGYLGTSSPALEPALLDAFRQGLRELGWVEGQNLVIEYRWAEGIYDRFPALVGELVRAHVDVLVTAGTPGTLAAQQATTTIPIVMAVSGDAVGAGLVASLARPGANITGLTAIVPDLEANRFQLLRELLPQASRVALLVNTRNPYTAVVLKQTQAAAAALQLTLHPVVEVGTLDEFPAAFTTLQTARPDVLVVLADRFLLAERTRIVDFAALHRLPALYPYREFVASGGLMSYAPSYAALFRRAAGFVDKLLKGAKPADLPVEQPVKFELVINLKTARAMGLTMPPTLLFQADEVIK